MELVAFYEFHFILDYDYNLLIVIAMFINFLLCILCAVYVNGHSAFDAAH
jgi:hypothetical protein